MKTNTIFFFVWYLTFRKYDKSLFYRSVLIFAEEHNKTPRENRLHLFQTPDRMWPKKGTFIMRWNYDDRWCLALTSPGFLAGEVEKWPSQGAPGRRKDRRHHTWPRIKKSRYWPDGKSRFRWNLGWLFSHLVSHCVRKRNVIATIKLKLQFVAVEMLEQKQNV